MGCSESSGAPAPCKPEPIPARYAVGYANVETALTVRLDGATIRLDLQVADVPAGGLRLTADEALDLALRLVGAVVRQRRAGMSDAAREAWADLDKLPDAAPHG